MTPMLLSGLGLLCSSLLAAQLTTTAGLDKKSFKRSRQTVIVKRLFDGYSKQDPPDRNRSTEVRLGIYVNSFYSINEQTMDYALNLYLRQSWRDPRLEFTLPKGMTEKVEQIKMDEGKWTELWLPDTFFRNEKEASYHDVTVANRVLRINASGHVWFTSKISATLSCPMRLHNYPLDTQICPMMFESFGYTMDTMYFTWLDNPVDVDKHLQLPQFFLVKTPKFDCSQNYTAGAFPCLSLHFVLRRDIGYFLIQVYVPTILIVILSWVSFWINIDASPARVSLGLLTVLTTTTMSGAARESLPRVSYIKAIDVWMIMCLVFVFASLIEYAVVNVAARHQVRVKPPPPHVTYRTLRGRPVAGSKRVSAGFNPNGASQKRSTVERLGQFLKLRSRGVGGADSESPTAGTSAAIVAPRPVDMDAGKRRARRIDKLSRKVFPLSFIAFNIVYWVVYTRSSSELDDLNALS